MAGALDLPTLRTARLILEPLSQVHTAGMFAMWSKPEVCLHSGEAQDFDGRPISLPAKTAADSDKIIDFFVRSAAEGTRFRWAVRLAAAGEFVGAVGFNSLGPCSEYAYHQHPDFWAQGLMMEASQAALDWLRQRADAREVEAFVEPDNHASIKLARKLGMQPTGEISDGAERYKSLTSV